MIPARYFTLFILFSFLGWVWETIYCSIKNGHFANRGFLFGPICPIYGFSVIILQGLYDFLPESVIANAEVWQVFVISLVGSAIVEYTTSWYMEKRFHARWWDYSRVPLNIQGRIAFPISVCFGIAGVLAFKFLLPALAGWQEKIPAIAFEIAAIVLGMVLGADFALTEANMSTLMDRVREMESEFVAFGESVMEAPGKAKRKARVKAEAVEAGIRARIQATSDIMSHRQRYILKNIRTFVISRRKEKDENTET